MQMNLSPKITYLEKPYCMDNEVVFQDRFYCILYNTWVGQIFKTTVGYLA